MIPQRPDNVVPAILLSLLALVLFDLMGLIIKHLSEDYSAAELSAYRNFFVTTQHVFHHFLIDGWIAL